MWARVTTLHVDRKRMEEMTRHIDEGIIPALNGMKGFVGGYWMVDETTGKAINVALWDTEDALRGSAMPVEVLRDAARNLGAMVNGIETFEVTNHA